MKILKLIPRGRPRPLIGGVTGLTLTEVLIVIGVLTVIFGFMVSIGSNFYSNQSLTAERDSVVSLLRHARTKAMSNINQSDHGLSVATTTYTVFEGSSYASRNQDFDEMFPRSGSVTIAGPSEVVFTAIEGNSSASGTISISYDQGQVNIPINYEGEISW